MLPFSNLQIFFNSLKRNSNKIKCLLRTINKMYSDEKKNSSIQSDKMEIAVLKEFSKPLQIESIDLPKISQSNEVVIDINYCALNGLDVLLCENSYSYKPKLPFVPGYEISGKLIVVGEEAKTAGYNIGDKVIAFNKKSFGGLAEQCVAKIEDVWKIPICIKTIDAVCLLENYMTALIGLEQFGSISEEDMVLVNVGIGGVGLAAVDIAANVFKAQVIGVGFSEDRADKIRERGAFHAFTYKEKKLLKELKEIANDRNIKNIFEGDSGEHFKKVLNSFTSVYQSKVPSKNLLRDDNFGVIVQNLSQEGRLIIAGVADININTYDQENKKDTFVITGINLTNYKKRKFDFYRQTADDVISFFEEGLIKPAPSLIAGLHAVNEAKTFISEMKACGKVIIDMKNRDVKTEIQ